MKRRSFLKSAGLLGASTIGMPYLLPTGRVFAKTEERKVNHVVFCLFAGGIRNIEAVAQAEGNLLPATFAGGASTMPGLEPIPSSPYPTLLRSHGSLFPEFRYKDGPTGHFNGHTVALTGNYTSTGLNLKANPQNPTVFEYYLKHNSPAMTSLNAWWISNSLGPYPALNYSSHPSYGPQFGANHIAPTALLNPQVFPAIASPKQFQFHEEEKIAALRGFLDQNFDRQGATSLGNVNSPEDAASIRQFIADLVVKGQTGGFNTPLGLSPALANNDVFTILFAEETIKAFQPELLVVNMTDVDACHQNFTAYCNNLRKADYAVAHLWKTIQETPGMANDTVMIMVPEHGRNLQGNTVLDIYGRNGIDHTGDATSREIFALILGPSGVIRQNTSFGTAVAPVGESIDLVPTVANLLGFDSNIPGGLLPGRVLQEAIL